jgi:hypothetical protein
VGFDWFECFFLLVIIRARNKLGSTLFTFILTFLKTNTLFICGFSGTLFNSSHSTWFSQDVQTNKQLLILDRSYLW